MKEFYGFKFSDVQGLIKLIKSKNQCALTQVFSVYAKRTGKSKGTVRNLYYAIAKRSNQDKAFTDKYLNGEPILVEQKMEFSKAQESELIKKILLKQKDGCSVRKAVFELSNGDQKLALRYQNKYRTAVKNNPDLIEKLSKEIGLKVEKVKDYDITKINEGQIAKLKGEINSLFDRTFKALKQENAALKQRLIELSHANNNLVKIIEQADLASAKRYFVPAVKENLLS